MATGRTRPSRGSVTGQHSEIRSENRTDRRVGKTLELLRDALATLIREKPYESIVVKDILDRANVGRSTFYTHFRDKDDLLVSSIHNMMQSVHSSASRSSTAWQERILWFSLPIFEYHNRHRHDSGFPVSGRAKAIHRERLQGVLTDVIAEPARREFQRHRKANAAPPVLLAAYVASTFVLVLDWWTASEKPVPPQQADAVFRSLVLPALAVSR